MHLESGVTVTEGCVLGRQVGQSKSSSSSGFYPCLYGVDVSCKHPSIVRLCPIIPSPSSCLMLSLHFDLPFPLPPPPSPLSHPSPPLFNLHIRLLFLLHVRTTFTYFRSRSQIRLLSFAFPDTSTFVRVPRYVQIRHPLSVSMLFLILSRFVTPHIHVNILISDKNVLNVILWVL